MARVRLQDVAERTGVSIKTVSNVVNGTGIVTEKTRKHVQEALVELKYRPNVAAQHLRQGRSGIIALAIPEITQPYFAEIAAEIIHAAKAQHLTVLLNRTGGQLDSEMAISDGIDMPLMDGLIMSPLVVTAEDLRHRGDSTPLVLLGEHIGPDRPFSQVAIDNHAAARMATEHLISLGRRRIAAIGTKDFGRNTTPGETAELRLEGFTAAIADAGIPLVDEWVIPVADFDRGEGAEAMRKLLDQRPLPDAVFCFNDLLALGALRTIEDYGMKAPGDVAVVGIDDIEEGRFSTPRLSTVAPDKKALAVATIDLLLGLRTDPTPRSVIIPHRLVARESTLGTGASRLRRNNP